MASWAGLLALSGFRYYGAEKSLEAKLRVNSGRFSSFWSTPTGWGTFSQTTQRGGTQFALSVLYGELACQSVALNAKTGESAATSTAKLGMRELRHQLRRNGGEVRIAFPDPIVLKEGDRLLITV